MGRIVSIDYGLARIGLAISDDRKIIATSLATLRAEKTIESTIQQLLKILEKYQIEAIVIGMPLHMNGKKGFLADEVQHFLSRLQTVVSCPVIPWDERLSTVQADRALREAQLTRKKRSQVVDQVTALILLQSYLDKLMLCQESSHLNRLTEKPA